MEKWQLALRKAVDSADELAGRFHLSPERLRRVADVFRFRVTPYYLSLIREKGDAIYRQCVPDEQELNGSPELMDDPLSEEQYSPVPNIVHRYPDRCLFLVSNECAMYCRFCTRKRKFRTPMCVDRAHVDEGLAYIRSRPEIRDVLVSGGDPFLLEDDRIEYILKNLRAIPHVEIIRIGTRTPCVLPERITKKLVSVLKKYHPLYINVHFNHPDELTVQSVRALSRLADAGIPLGSQTVLLKGVNDNPETMKLLMQKLLAARVKPYYIFQTDLVFGTEHFRTPLSCGLEIVDRLRGWTTGMAVPQYVIDLPNGGGKVPILPEYQMEKKGNVRVFRNFCGERFEYPDLKE